MRSFIAALLCLVTLTTLEAQLFRRRAYAAPPVYRPIAPPPIAQPQQYQMQPPVSRLDEKKDGHHGYNLGEVAELPTDADKLHMTLVLADDWQAGQNERAKACRAMKSWLETEQRLVKYRLESRFSFLLDSDPGFRGLRTLASGEATSLYAKYGDAFPLLVITKPDGEMVYKCSALSLPKNGGDLGDRVTYALKHHEKQAPAFDAPLKGTPFMTEGGEDCGPDGCPPNQPNKPHVDKSEVLEDSPQLVLGSSWIPLAVIAIGMLAFGGIVGATIYRNRKSP